MAGPTMLPIGAEWIPGACMTGIGGRLWLNQAFMLLGYPGRPNGRANPRKPRTRIANPRGEVRHYLLGFDKVAGTVHQEWPIPPDCEPAVAGILRADANRLAVVDPRALTLRQATRVGTAIGQRIEVGTLDYFVQAFDESGGGSGPSPRSGGIAGPEQAAALTQCAFRQSASSPASRCIAASSASISASLLPIAASRPRVVRGRRVAVRLGVAGVALQREEDRQMAAHQRFRVASRLVACSNRARSLRRIATSGWSFPMRLGWTVGG